MAAGRLIWDRSWGLAARVSWPTCGGPPLFLFLTLCFGLILCFFLVLVGLLEIQYDFPYPVSQLRCVDIPLWRLSLQNAAHKRVRVLDECLDVPKQIDSTITVVFLFWDVLGRGAQ